VVYVVVGFRLKRAEEEEGQGRGRRARCVFWGKELAAAAASSMARVGRGNGRKVRPQAWKRADEKKELQVPLYTAQVPLSECQLARVVAPVVSACMCA
jgi:hypothetical protein